MEPFDGAEDAAGPWPRRLPSEWVYCAAWPDYVKIGWSIEPDRRVRNLRAPSARKLCRAPDGIEGAGELIGAIRGGRDVEQLVMVLMAEDSAGGEWFFRGARAELVVSYFRRHPYRRFDPMAPVVF